MLGPKQEVVAKPQTRKAFDGAIPGRSARSRYAAACEMKLE